MTFAAVMAGAFGLGLMTAISPCPLATNIAAVSFLGRSAGDSKRVLMSALLYTLGRTLVYVGLGVALLWAFGELAGGAGSISEFASPASRRFQRYGNMSMGPALLLIGMILLGLVEINFSLSVGGSKLQDRVSRGGAIWALPLGGLFALAFCPPSAALFLSAMVISAEHGSTVLPPVAYGIGTAAPVIGFAIIIAFAGGYVGKAFNVMTKIEQWFRLAAGVVFVVVGIHYTLTHIYGLRLWV